MSNTSPPLTRGPLSFTGGALPSAGTPYTSTCWRTSWSAMYTTRPARTTKERASPTIGPLSLRLTTADCAAKGQTSATAIRRISKERIENLQGDKYDSPMRVARGRGVGPTLSESLLGHDRERRGVPVAALSA